MLESRAVDSADDRTYRVPDDQIRPEPLGASVVLLRGKERERYPLSTSPTVVGSGADCDLIVEERTVSRRHVELSLVREGILVRDLGSRNGTFYLGQRVESMVLSFGAQLLLGGELKVELELDDSTLEDGLVYEGDGYHRMVGRAPAMRRLFALLTRLEGSLATVLIEGESGVGKELVAEALHARSAVSGGPFVAVNCGALPKELIGSELFGHRRGAFTGAHESRQGAFERAHAGTLFLDEIGELPMELQPLLLRVLDNRVYRAVGSDVDQQVSARIVTATNRSLEEEVAAGRFREDLFYRLAVVRLDVPPLGQRREDIPALALQFAQQLGGEELPREIIQKLAQRRYPGNVRELRNAVQAFMALGVLPKTNRKQGELLELALAELVDTSAPYAAQKERIVDVFTRHYLEALIRRTGGNKSAAARLAELDRTHLGRLLAKYGLG